MISLFLPVAHGLLVGRQDLPIPAWLFAWGASIVLIVSFVALSVAWRDRSSRRIAGARVPERLSRPAVTALGPQIVTGAIGVFLLGAVVYAGLEGTDEPNLNFAVTFVFVTFWLGMVVLSILLGDVFRAFNPWRAIARAVGAAVPADRRPAPLAAAPLSGAARALARGRRESSASSGSSSSTAPAAYESAGPATEHGRGGHRALAYTAYTLVAMALFGVETWLRRGEAFSVYYGMFSQLAPLEVRDGRLGVRRPLAAATHWATRARARSRWSSRRSPTTTFDGAQEGLWQEPIRDLFEPPHGPRAWAPPPPFAPRSRSSSRSPWREWRRSTGPACAGCAPCAAPRR